uniref:Peptidase M16 C-terminal domain-containing protein n=1 Tax=uncultured Alphaproteobacteria bacterium TaxID=91750 RepID=A0A6G8F3B3_9PROT|nr:hypothetical protein PlAlph_5740 [uncultured Alphaproteobacteria bacterium]
MGQKTFKLDNGLTVMVSRYSSHGQASVSLTVNVGHVNEPKLGLAALFEKVLMEQAAGMQAVYGGTITTYFTGGASYDLELLMRKLSNLIMAPHFNSELIKLKANDIIEHTRDLAPLPKRQMKLLYKHTAFGDAKKVWNADVYIDAVSSYGVADLKEFAEKYMTAKNMVVAISGDVSIEQVQALAEKYFAEVPAGRRHKVQNDIYTGGFNRISSPGGYRQVMLGWDVSNLSNAAEANVMMSMLSGRLERAFIGKDVDIEVKIAGYYGMRTLRISVTSHNEEEVNEFTDIICANVHRLRTTLASDRRMETSRNRAMTEKLFTFSQPQDSAVEIAWQLLGRGIMYDINERINATWQVSARDVQEIAESIFSRPLTYVVYAKKPYYTYQEVVGKL